MGQRARRAFEAEFDKSIAIARWERLLLDVTGPAVAGHSLRAKLPPAAAPIAQKRAV
jgi:hypothetical protein